MKINSFKILYSTTIPIQSYGVNDKIAVEMEYQPDTMQNIETGEVRNVGFDLEELVRQQKNELDAIVAKLYPNRYGSESVVDLREVEREMRQQSSTPEERRVGNIVNDIYTCEELWQLETYKLIAKSKPEFQEAYDEMFNKLSPKSAT
jgi:hypothetical protein